MSSLSKAFRAAALLTFTLTVACTANREMQKPSGEPQESEKPQTNINEIINKKPATASPKRKSKVFLCHNITPEKTVELYKLTENHLEGRVAVKIQSGEKGNTKYIKPEFWKPVVNHVNGTVVECSSAYPGTRNTADRNKELVAEHEWDKYFNFDILDNEGPDAVLEIPDGKVITRNYVGKDINNYDSMLVLNHFKGHAMEGYGGALKQLAIGCASSAGKSYIHTAGKTKDQSQVWQNITEQDKFLEAMADAATSVARHFNGNIVYINVMMNISADCYCDATPKPPGMQDIGILSSTDPVAIDKACLDLIYAATADPGQKHIIERIESMHGAHTIEAAEALGCGSSDYELITVE